MKKRNVAMIVLLLVLAVSAFARGGGEYPARDIEFYINANAGGGTDAICRKIAELAQPTLGGEFYMVNHPGVSDTVAPHLLMAARPDGYTISGVTYGPIVTGPYQREALGIPGYDLNKLEFICRITQESDAFMVGANTPYRTIDDIVQAAKARPGQIALGDQGIGSRVNLVVRKFERAYGVEFKKLSYTSSAPQREAMLSGEIEIAVTSLGDFNAAIRDGSIRGLCELSTVRNPAYPDIPTSTELGMSAELLSGSFVAIAVPAGTPVEIKTKLEAAFKAAATSQEFITWCASVGVTPSFLPSTEMPAFIADVQKDFAVLDELKAAGLLR